VVTEESTKESSSDSSIQQMVTFQVGGEEYGFGILDIREIVRQASIARIPLAPRHVKGVTNLRGEVLPVVDLRSQFGLPEADYSEKSRILVVDRDDHHTGLIVDEVHEVAKIESNQLEDPPDTISGATGRYLKKLARLESGKRIVMNLDPNKVCEFEIDKELFELETRVENKQAASGDSASETERHELVVIFVSDGIEYCLPIASVDEVIRVQKPRRASNTPDILKGVLSLRGSVLPVVDMRRLYKRRSYLEHLASRVHKVREQLQDWLGELREAFEGQLHFNGELREAGRKIAESVLELRSSDPCLNSAYDSLRATLQALLKELQEGQSEPASLLSKLEAAAPQIMSALERCAAATSSEECLQDQRIIVVNSGSLTIGLQVDEVREVKPIPIAAIEEPPSLSKFNSKQLCGIAKLDGGERIILMVDSELLLPKPERKQLQDSLEAEQQDGTEYSSMTQDRVRATTLDELQLVCFRIGKDEFGAPIHSIREIDRVSRITPIPDGPEYIDGICNLRGEVLPIVNLRKRFAMPERKMDEKSRIIVADLDGEKTGLLVDSVSHVLRISTAVISGPPREIGGSTLIEFISGIAKADNGERIIVLLDIEKLLQNTDTTSCAN